MTAADEPPPPRQPDGVFLDPAAALPEPHPVVTAGGIVALAPPVTRTEIATLVHAYFRAFTQGEVGAFNPLLAPGARRLLDEGESTELPQSLEKRLRSVDYTHLAFRSFAAYDDLRVTRFEDTTKAQRDADTLREGDLVVDVPVRVERAGGVRVFGSSVRLVLRRPDARGPWLIAAVREPDGPWS